MAIMDTRPDHAATVRVIASAVARDMRAAAGGVRGDHDLGGLNALFRLHAQWRSHGWYGDPSMERLKDICAWVFACDAPDHRAFARGLRSAASIAVEGSDEAPATIDDRDVFWRCLEALGAETGVEMPTRPPESGRASIRGH